MVRLIPTVMREWMMERNVCAMTAGRPPLISAIGFSPLSLGKPSIERHDRVDADQKLGAVLQSKRGMQCLGQRTVDIVAAADSDRREQSWQRGARLNRQ